MQIALKPGKSKHEVALVNQTGIKRFSMVYASAVLSVVVFIGGCGGSGNSPVQNPTIASVTVSPASPSVAVAGTTQFAAIAKDSNGNGISGAIFTWSSSDSNVATISSAGLATGIATGTTDITATASGVKSNLATLTVTAPIPPLSFNGSTLPSAVDGQQYTATLAAYGGTQPYTFSITEGKLPNGLSGVSGNDSFVISGTPNDQIETYSFSVQVTDSSSPAQTESASFALSLAAASNVNEWTWESGSPSVNVAGVYGVKGVAAAGNSPGARGDAVGVTDSSGNLWLFAGDNGGNSLFNDLWEFNPTLKEWTWVSGSNAPNAAGVYGTQGVAALGNVPGARRYPLAWADDSGNLWFFGGFGKDSTGTLGLLNDLWEFSPSANTWTWVSGSSTGNAPGVYGTEGVASVNNVPGARGGDGPSVSWTDSTGNFWLFGGFGNDSSTINPSDPDLNAGYLNDLWEFSPTMKTWTWVSGSNYHNAPGVYGTEGVPSVNNIPGARSYSVSWTDKNGNFWLFGGYPNVSINGDFNDLWEFNPVTKGWTWVGGSLTGQVEPVYGTQGLAAPVNTPGGRDSAVSWTDNTGNLWLFGGFDYEEATGANDTNQYLNDLWEFSTTTKEWTWVGGSDSGGASGVYGSLGVAAPNNVPGARGSQGIPASWTDSGGNFWLFGGQGYGSGGVFGELNDLWNYQP